MFRRIRNLIALSNYRPLKEGEIMHPDRTVFALQKDSKPAKYPARILEDDPKEMFEEHNEQV